MVTGDPRCVSVTGLSLRLQIAEADSLQTHSRNNTQLDLGSIRSSPRYGCTEFVYPECLHFDNDDKIDDVLLEHGRLPHVLPLAVHLRFFSLIDK